MSKNFLINLVKVSIISAPASYFFYGFVQKLLDQVVGGINASAGFPIPYYFDVLATPKIEFNQPYLNIINYLLYYLVFTIGFYFIYSEVFKKKNS